MAEAGGDARTEGCIGAGAADDVVLRVLDAVEIFDLVCSRMLAVKCG